MPNPVVADSERSVTQATVMRPPQTVVPRWKLDPFKVALYAALHVGAVAAFFFVSPSALVAASVLYLVAGFGVTLGYHRLLTHRSYETFRPIKALLSTCGTLAFLGGPIDWVGKHRRHHSLSERTGDVHCPKHGLVWSQIGWLLVDHPFDSASYAPDLQRLSYLRVVERLGWLLPLLAAALIFAWGEIVYSTGLSWFLWAVCFRAVFSIHVAGFVNTVAHSVGKRRFATCDDSRNVWWVALLTLGEGWHNNHHASPRSAAHGRHWYEIDPTYWMMCMMERAGLAWNVVHPGSRRDLAALSRLTRNTDADCARQKSDRDTMRQLYRLRSSIWIRDAAFDWLVIAATLYAINIIGFVLAWPIGILIIGARQHALALLGHDAAHRLAFKNRRFNDLIGNVLVAWPLFVVLGGYRPWHFEHHRRLGTADDPELHYRAFRPYEGRASWTKICRVFIFDLLGFGAPDLIVFMKEIFPYRRPITFLGPVATWGVFAAITFYLAAPWVFFVWAASLLTGFWAVFRMRSWAEHIAVPEPWNLGKENTHRLSAGWLTRFLFFPHNTYCHYEHHKCPQVPYYNLPALRDSMSARTVVPMRRLFPTS